MILSFCRAKRPIFRGKLAGFVSGVHLPVGILGWLKGSSCLLCAPQFVRTGRTYSGEGTGGEWNEGADGGDL